MSLKNLSLSMKFLQKRRGPRTERSPEQGVALADGLTGSHFLHGAMRDAASAFPEAFADAPPPEDARVFREALADAAARFESRRLESPDRVAIARHLADWTADRLVFRDADGVRPLREHLAPDRAPPVTVAPLGIGGKARPEGWFAVPFGGKVLRGDAVSGLVDRLHTAHDMSDAAREALRRVVMRGERGLELAGQRFAILGAGAELAPTELLLEAGADVLWIDRAPPEPWLKARFGARPVAGRLFLAPGAGCLLSETAAIAAAIRAFAASGAGTPVHLGLFAYAPGRGRELRLAGAMDLITRALGSSVVASVSMYVSPTTPGEVTGSCRAAAECRLAHPPAWHSPLLAVGALSGPGFLRGPRGEVAVARSVVPLQGPTYLAAQYLTKMMTAEAMAADGGDAAGQAKRVSANVAGITATRSLEHPLFQAAFIGAPNFLIHIFKSETTRAMSALLMLEDIFGERPVSLGAIHHRQIHGGVYSHPYLFERTIRAGAVIGLSKRPGLVLRLRG